MDSVLLGFSIRVLIIAIRGNMFFAGFWVLQFKHLAAGQLKILTSVLLDLQDLFYLAGFIDRFVCCLLAVWFSALSESILPFAACHLSLFIFIWTFIRFVFACRPENCVLIFTQTETVAFSTYSVCVLRFSSRNACVYKRLSLKHLHFYCLRCFISRLPDSCLEFCILLRILWRIVAKSSSKLSASHFQLTFDEFNLLENLQPKMLKLFQQLSGTFRFCCRCRWIFITLHICSLCQFFSMFFFRFFFFFGLHVNKPRQFVAL